MAQSTCAHCGALIPANAGFCPMCGTAALARSQLMNSSEVGSANQYATDQPAKQTRPRSRVLPYVVAGVVALAIILILAAGLSSGWFTGGAGLGGSGAGSGSGDPPIAVSISAGPQTGSHPLDVAFSSSVTGGTQPYTYQWRFGDGTTASTPTVSHTYDLRGTYTVDLTVTDADSRSESATPVTITVNPVLYTDIIEDANGLSIGVGIGGALQYDFTVPQIGPAPEALNATISGTVDVTACGFLCSNLAAFVLLVTPSEAQTILSGGSSSTVWCFSAGGGTCSAEQYQSLNSLDLSYYAGQQLVLLIYNSNITVGQTANINVSVYYSA
jgi:PKD repeat protein